MGNDNSGPTFWDFVVRVRERCTHVGYAGRRHDLLSLISILLQHRNFPFLLANKHKKMIILVFKSKDN